MSQLRVGIVALVGAAIAGSVYAEESRRIEEVVVTAERRQSTVADTSISITAIGAEMIEDLGIQNANEFVDFIPATTRDNFDIRIRGVGRNFRALGGDPGVATYYNGVYSEDALIALTENGLWDVERIEVLRGPQGTLYGRNSIGGAINYITKQPTEEFSGLVRAQFGDNDTKELYGALSGPIIGDKLLARLTGSKRSRDGFQEGQFGSEDIDAVNDQNFALALEWKPSDDWNINIRGNDRRSLRKSGASSLINAGWGARRGTRDANTYALGIIPVASTFPGAEMFTHPDTGAVAWGASPRPGVDASSSSIPDEGFGGPGYLNGFGDLDDVDPEGYTNNYSNEEFDQQGVTVTAEWDFSQDASLKYIYGYS
ncbi:MAG: TonB-dependent receptor plug domain-containing protein, partial [Proteobacteria bacterium]|nr:TonB-dependent receptor plug domain-containing protein [Pseudomonadota bacterium]